MRQIEKPAGQGGFSEETAVGAVSACDITHAVTGGATFAPGHAAELAASAVPLEVAHQQGVYTAWTARDLPEPVRWLARSADRLPALVYPMAEIDGTQTCQVKPAIPVDDAKYVGPSKLGSGHPPQLPVLRWLDGAETVVMAEGCKQALAVLAHGPADVSVVRFTGVHSWMSDGAPSAHLGPIVAGKKVVICGDADAAVNVAVFDGLTELGEAAKAAGASAVAFVRVPGVGKQGVDDVLAGLPDDAARRDAVATWLGEAKPTPADLTKTRLAAMRKARARQAAERTVADTAVPDRVDYLTRGDFHVDCTAIAQIVADRAGGLVLFERDGAVELVRGPHGPALRPLGVHDLHRQALASVRLLTRDREGNVSVVPGLKPEQVGILRGHLTPQLPVVVRVSDAPVVRPDGTIVTRSGYDAKTGVYLTLDASIEGMDVPAHPTDAVVPHIVV